ncbi:MAG: hypothetical protein AVDCRST_MAG19-2048 [uncultured Thermomicrobiales bacterium]|uniref:N-acetylmuramoyl-L-alanine amidase n=1 Tax=uncultured Thermomicrobiales bacterium TaxID=1645740 RepID=A0A6J4UZI8_9BACT|nr:MAG: hypothetical protein AVDCRST_MAG19-2048 [uncultured Thermomicrobiales bacterium]
MNDHKEAFGRRLDRRAVLSASTGLAAMALLRGGWRVPTARAVGDDDTVAGEWAEDEAQAQVVPGAEGEPRSFETETPFYAVAPHWGGEAEPGATVEISVSPDGETWSEPVLVAQADAEGGRPDRDGRRFGRLVAAQRARFVRYRAFDAAGEPTRLPRLAFTYIDASRGPRLDSLGPRLETIGQPVPGPTSPAVAPPPIVSRAAWGADESLRFGSLGEIWPVAYRSVEHVVIHHTDTANFNDPLLEMRSIYYYHAVSRGWGDIGYNYLVDFLGNVYEGRVGGEGAVAGHAAGYNEGTAGIGTIGRFDFATATPEARAGLVAITAWAGRNLDPLGVAPFNDIASLPTICAHRDVNPSGCPGDGLYEQLPAIRDDVANALAGTAPATPNPAFAPGDAVTSAVPDGTLREGPGLTFPVITQLALGEPLVVADGPATNDGLVWYQLQGATLAGWAAADLLTGAVGGPTAGTPEPDAVPFEAASGTRFVAGDAASVVDGALNLHAAAGLGTPVLVVLPDGTPVAIVGGPVEADGFVWYEIDASPYGVGWCVGDFLRRS